MGHNAQVDDLPFFRSVQLSRSRLVLHVNDVYFPRGRVEVHLGPTKLDFLVGVLLVDAHRLPVGHFTDHRYRMTFRDLISVGSLVRRQVHTDGESSRVHLNVEKSCKHYDNADVVGGG